MKIFEMLSVTCFFTNRFAYFFADKQLDIGVEIYPQDDVNNKVQEHNKSKQFEKPHFPVFYYYLQKIEIARVLIHTQQKCRSYLLC